VYTSTLGIPALVLLYFIVREQGKQGQGARLASA
jgi:hypothetical protein